MRGFRLALLAVLLCACGPAAGGDEELTVFAAASLTDAFAEVAATFEAQHPGLRVRLNLAGSQTLATQLLEGAPGDVFAAADTAAVDRVVAAGLATSPVVFAANHLVIAVEAGNPRGITDLHDLGRDDLLLVLPAETVPAGAYAAAALERAGVTARPASLEPDVRAALGKVVLGEADAAIVYASDVAAVDARVDAIGLPPAADLTATYPVAVLDGARQPAATQFVALLRSAAGRDILRRHGFAPPAAEGAT